MLRIFLLALSVALAAAERRLLMDVATSAPKCRNTVQGLNYIADDRGMVCKRPELSYSTGCCSTGQQHDCSLCTLHDKCCSEFEACVSCCLAPKHNAAALAKQTLRSPRHKDSGFWGDPFEYCKGLCRTHSRSTAHENSYISSRHHCFSQHGRPSVSDPLPPGVLDGATVVMSDANESCDAACAKQQLSCSAPHLKWANSCDRLREHNDCEAGCDTLRVGGAMPAYVEGGAPKQLRPAMCFVAAAEAQLGCSAKETNYRRLCTCVK